MKGTVLTPAGYIIVDFAYAYSIPLGAFDFTPPRFEGWVLTSIILHLSSNLA